MDTVLPREPIPESVVHDYLNGVGNHEVKTLLASYLLTQPHQWQTARNLAATLRDSQGEVAAWTIRPHNIANYCERSLEPVGAAIRGSVTTVDGKEHKAWQASTDHAAGKLALGGFLLNWSLRWPDISLQQVYGSTSSSTDVRSPQTRHIIYAAILEKDNGPSIIDVTKYFEDKHGDDENTTAINENINTLVAHGLLAKISNRRGNDPRIRVDANTYTRKGVGLEETSRETQALYAVIGTLAVGAELSMNELLSAAMNIDTQIDTVLLRQRVRQRLRDGRTYPGLSFVYPTHTTKTSESQVILTSTAQEPISELINGVSSLIRGKDTIFHADRAREILSNTHNFNELVSKARHFSPRANAQGREKDMRLIEAIIKERGALTANATRTALIDEHQRVLSLLQVRKVLRNLVESGRLVKGTINLDRHSKITSNTYRT